MKLYEIINDKQNNEVISWDASGRLIIVKNVHDFTENILPKYYKHNNFASFIRQLNLYDFHKKRTKTNENIFYHQYFQRDHKELLTLIKRKNPTNNSYNNIINNDQPFVPNGGNNLNDFMYFNIPNSLNNNKGINMNYGYNIIDGINYINGYQNKNMISGNSIENSGDNPKPSNNIQSLPNYFPPQEAVQSQNKLALTNASQNQNLQSELSLIEYGQNSSGENSGKISKKITKKNLENLLLFLIQNNVENKMKQKQLEEKFEKLSKENEETRIQNQKLLIY